jgi:hypothetical protein
VSLRLLGLMKRIVMPSRRVRRERGKREAQRECDHRKFHFRLHLEKQKY